MKTKKKKPTLIDVEWIDTDGLVKSEEIAAFNKKQFDKKFHQLEMKLKGMGAIRSDSCFDTLHIANRSLWHKWFK